MSVNLAWAGKFSSSKDYLDIYNIISEQLKTYNLKISLLYSLNFESHLQLL